MKSDKVVFYRVENSDGSKEYFSYPVTDECQEVELPNHKKWLSSSGESIWFPNHYIERIWLSGAFTAKAVIYVNDELHHLYLSGDNVRTQINGHYYGRAHAYMLQSTKHEEYVKLRRVAGARRALSHGYAVKLRSGEIVPLSGTGYPY